MHEQVEVEQARTPSLAGHAARRCLQALELASRAIGAGLRMSSGHHRVPEVGLVDHAPRRGGVQPRDGAHARRRQPIERVDRASQRRLGRRRRFAPSPM